MKINEGNIFEAMRLVLPEHREMMRGWSRQRHQQKFPILSEDEIQEMQYILSEAIEARARVRITLFGAHDNTVFEGIPMFKERLYIVSNTGKQIIDVERLMHIERME